MARVHLTLACGEYDRTLALMTGRVRTEGIELNYLPMYPGELFQRVARNREFEVAEMSMGSYLTLRSRDDDGLIAIPVFPSRVFRHSYIFVNAEAGIREPRDLVGRRVGTEQYQLTASVWLRGILQDEHGVCPTDVEWFIGGQDHPDVEERVPLRLPPDVRAQRIPPGATLGAMLEAGEIDALFAPHIPACFRRGSPRVRRLFADVQEVEADYFRRTGFFPIMHTVVLRQDVYQRYPWAALSLYRAFCAAKAHALARLRFTGTLAASVPWLVPALEQAEALFGERYWPYGVEANRAELETLVRYTLEQGLAARPMALEELFAVETLGEEDR